MTVYAITDTKKGRTGIVWPEWPHPLSLYRCVPRGPADPDWTMPDALYRGRAGCSSLREVVVELVVVESSC